MLYLITTFKLHFEKILKKHCNVCHLVSDSLGIHLEEPQPSIPPPKPMIDYSHEAAEYERKLIQVPTDFKYIITLSEHGKLSCIGSFTTKALKLSFVT